MVIQSQITKHYCASMKLGTNGKHLLPDILKVIPRSSIVIQSQTTKHYCASMKLGTDCKHLIPDNT